MRLPTQSLRPPPLYAHVAMWSALIGGVCIEVMCDASGQGSYTVEATFWPLFLLSISCHIQMYRCLGKGEISMPNITKFPTSGKAVFEPGISIVYVDMSEKYISIILSNRNMNVY